ncbi:protein artemis [Myripristis murdjan]|uniref:protein artemis n=1 Tax=Myripristis murdjan TaxID=586833 RepID=UPI0011762DBB|nr:protein artemis [Myripristis murdjan]
MSSFAGRMKEYPTISLDRFDRENLHARAYFLSHCHKDHMKGLKGPLLRRKLNFSRTVKLYCSYVTKELLLSNPKYAFWEEHIVPLELESPTQISLVDEASGEKEEIVVTLLPAGHCPGSVMFLIEGSQGNVLYTGDFRFAVGDASRIEFLHSGSRVKDIQSVYLDSTFYDPRYYQIPSRESCLKGISELVGNWISQSAYHVVWLNCKAAYGYEYLFTNLGEEFNTQVHVSHLKMFKKMPEILSYVTTKRSTQIHACRHAREEEFLQGNRLPCGSVAPDGTPFRIISIKPSTMWFGERSKKGSVIVKTGNSSYRACFSFHSSFSEIKDFLSYLQPVNIYPSVIPIGRTLTDVTELLKPMCRSQSEQAVFIYKPLGILKRTRVQLPTYDSDTDDELFDGPDIAPVRKKMALNKEVKSHVEVENPLTLPVEEPLPVTVTVIQSTAANYMDCTESNDEEEEEEEEDQQQGETETGMEAGEKEEAKVKKEMNEVKEEEGEERREPEKRKTEHDERKESLISTSKPPKWEDFFTTETLTDSQNSLTSQSQSCCSLTSPSPSRMTGSQTPELFSDNDEDDTLGQEKLSSAPSTSLCRQVSREQEPSLLETFILQPEQRRQEHGVHRSDAVPLKNECGDHSVQPKGGELSESQTSSDFDIPCTPESHTPHADELSQLYRRLASGEEVIIRKGSQGSI